MHGGRGQPYVVALTGGIASGKSAASRAFEELGVSVIDTDMIAQSLVRKGTPLLARIKASFGDQIVDESGELRRRRLRRIIISDAKRRALLESIMHPAIIRETLRQVEESTEDPYCIVVVPLLTEIGVPEWVDRVLLVEAREETRIARLQSRDSVSHEEAELTLQAQASGKSRREIADDRLVNDSSLSELKAQVDMLHHQYLRLARSDGREDRLIV